MYQLAHRQACQRDVSGPSLQTFFEESLTKVEVSIVFLTAEAFVETLLEPLAQGVSNPPDEDGSKAEHTSRISISPKSLDEHQPLHVCIPLFRHSFGEAYFCANQAFVTTLSFSLMAVNVCGFSVMTTTAFCTVLRVTSAGRLSSSLESSWRVQLMPNSERSGVLFKTSVKYEKSSVALQGRLLARSCFELVATRGCLIYA